MRRFIAILMVAALLVGQIPSAAAQAAARSAAVRVTGGIGLPSAVGACAVTGTPSLHHIHTLQSLPGLTAPTLSDLVLPAPLAASPEALLMREAEVLPAGMTEAVPPVGPEVMTKAASFEAAEVPPTLTSAAPLEAVLNTDGVPAARQGALGSFYDGNLIQAGPVERGMAEGEAGPMERVPAKLSPARKTGMPSPVELSRKRVRGHVTRLEQKKRQRARTKIWRRGILVGLLGAAVATPAWGATSLHNGLTNFFSSLILVAAFLSAAAVAKWTVRLVKRLVGKVRESTLLPRLTWKAWLGLLSAGLTVGLSFGAVPQVFSRIWTKTVYRLVQPKSKVRILDRSFGDAVQEGLSRTPAGREVLEGLRDRGGVIRMPHFFVGDHPDFAGRYVSPSDHVDIPVRHLQQRGWTVEEFLKDPAKWREYIADREDTLVHELMHALQFRRPFWFPGILIGNGIEYEWEANLKEHSSVHQALQADPGAPIRWGALYEYENFLDDLNAELERIENHRLYRFTWRLNVRHYNEWLKQVRASWPAHRVEGYMLLHQRFLREKPSKAMTYLNKAQAAAAEAGLPVPEAGR